jgi:hypothetical protein
MWMVEVLRKSNPAVPDQNQNIRVMNKNNPWVYSAIIVLIFTMMACSSTQTTSTVDRDGSSIEKAIIVKSVSAEYDWIRKNYPGAKVTEQALINKGRKQYDVLTFTTSTGETKEAYFDINSFFGKGF